MWAIAGMLKVLSRAKHPVSRCPKVSVLIGFPYSVHPSFLG